MFKRILFGFLVLFISASGISAETIVKPPFNLSKSFANVPGTPRIVRNGFDHEWLTVWRQQGAPSKIVGRRILSDGSLKKKKVLVKGVSDEPQSLDVSFDTVNYNYLLAFETSSGLQVQLFNSALGKLSAARTVEGGVSGTIPRFGFDVASENFLLFWLSDNQTTLKVILVDSTGNLVGTAQTLAKAPAGNTFLSLNVSTNQSTHNFLAIVLPSSGASGKLQGYNVKPDGTLLRKKPTAITAGVAGLNTFGDAGFADLGSGVTLWSEGDAVKRRKLSKTGKNASAAQSLSGEADVNTTETAVLFDSRANLFVGAWTLGNKVRAAAFNSSTGAVTDNPFDVATSSLAASMNAAASYDGAAGNTIVVWEDSTADAASIAGNAAAKFRVRGAIFFVKSTSSQEGVSIGDNFFRAPDGTTTVTIEAGDSVTWTNNGSTAHTVTSNTGAWPDSGSLNPGAIFEVRFTTEGIYQYHCNVHGAAVMSGTVVVTEAPEPY